MFKKLDKLILRAFVGPFLATFLIAIFVLILQFFWLWIDDFVGKGIDLTTLSKVIFYVALTWVPVALPLAVLLSTIMTFGSLGETYELVAIKSAGISLNRFMRPILFVAIVITGIAFAFNNYFLPVANLKLNKLKYEIVYSKPAFDIKPGIFYNSLEGFIIKLGSKNETGSAIKDVLIYERNNYLQDNLILADSGSMSVSGDKRFLNFLLFNGHRYEERGPRNSIQTELIRLNFKEYQKVFDLSTFLKVESNDSAFKDNYRMLNLRQLTAFMDTAKVKRDSVGHALTESFAKQTLYISKHDSGKLKFPTITKPINNIKQIIPDSASTGSIDIAYSAITSSRGSTQFQYSEYLVQDKNYREYLLGWHQKFSFAAACLVMFLIGAPLGAIIRKGGIGSPLVFAVIFFAIYHLLNTTGEKMAKEGVIPVAIGAWLPVVVLIPIGLFLVNKARKDSQLFNKEFYYRTSQQFREYLSKTRLIKK